MVSLDMLRSGSLSGTKTDVSPFEIHPNVQLLAKVMDDVFVVPGTNFRIGLDGIIGLIPVAGDVATIFIGGVILQEAKRLGVSRWTQFRMYMNYAIDLVVGIVPLVGDLFDFAFKAHRRNIQLMQDHLDRSSSPPSRIRWHDADDVTMNRLEAPENEPRIGGKIASQESPIRR